MSHPTKHNVLFLECGSSGQGGSFRSLKEHIQIMRDTLNKIVVVLVNKSVFEKDYLSLGCEVIQLKHPIYSRGSKWLMGYNQLFALCRRISLNLTVYFQLLVEWHFSYQLRQLIIKNHIDLLYLNNQPMRNFSGFIAAKKTKVSVVSHIRTLHTFGFSDYFYRYIRTISAKFIAISHAVRTEWNQFGIDSEVIYNPVPVTERSDKGDKEYDLIYVGRLVDGKGIASLINAIAPLQDEYRLKLAIVGDGPLRADLEKLAIQKKISDMVFFLGYQEDVLDCIAKATILVLPTENEGLGRVVIEAMKLKVAVIAANTGGVKELIENNVSGILYNTENELELIMAIRKFLSSDTLRLRCIEVAYRQAMLRFSTVHYYNQLKLLLEGVDMTHRKSLE